MNQRGMYQFQYPNYITYPSQEDQLAKRELRRLEECYHDELCRVSNLICMYGGSNEFTDQETYRQRYEIEQKYERLKDQIMSDYRYNYTYLNTHYTQYTPPYYIYPPVSLLLENKTVPTEPKKYIIISSEGAATKPEEHKTLAEAETEAKRLARKYPKQEFTVYETKKSFKITEPVEEKVFI